MSLTFYFAPMSTASVTNLILAELGVPHERVLVDLKKSDTKKDAYLKLDPNGRVPLIVHEGVPIFESSAITMYLGETFGVDKGLYPAAGPKRGEAMKWIAWANVTLAGAVTLWARNTQEWVPAEQRNAKAGEAGRAELDKCLAILDGALDGRSFLVGDYTLADAHVHSFVSWIGMMGVDAKKFTRLQKWLDTCAERPAFKKVMAEHG